VSLFNREDDRGYVWRLLYTLFRWTEDWFSDAAASQWSYYIARLRGAAGQACDNAMLCSCLAKCLFKQSNNALSLVVAAIVFVAVVGVAGVAFVAVAVAFVVAPLSILNSGVLSIGSLTVQYKTHKPNLILKMHDCVCACSCTSLKMQKLEATARTCEKRLWSRPILMRYYGP
jgi:hypothetical protein